MFSNITGQDNVVRLLKNDIIKKSLNNSMIFHGEKGNGKLTAALEFTRAINCRQTGETTCQCQNCIRIRNLDFEGLIFLSRRDFFYYLFEYLEAYKKEKNPFFYEKIKKIVKLVFLPLQSFLIKDIFSESDKKSLFESSEALQNILSKQEIASSDGETILKSVKKVNDLYKKPGIPINMLREALNWTYISQPDINRVVIIDRADLLEHSSRNVLLKRLEEPSPNLFFILIAENKNRIIQTIKSRCRPYFFNNLKKDAVMKIIQNNFKEGAVYASVAEFLERSDENSKANIYPLVVKLLNLVFLKEHKFNELSLFLNTFSDRKKVRSLLLNLSLTIEKELLERGTGGDAEPDIKALRNIGNLELENLNKILKDRINKIDVFYLTPALTLEGIFYPLKAMVLNGEI
ncbi:MAG TPA: hypothetical protein PLO89_02195 [Spirochaetota bacterium]|nr:hypothetical protein [Spirochaetota bacterium]